MHRVKINGLSVAYEQTGDGPALVLLHGFIIDSRMWRLQLESLSDQFTVIAWDAPGTGQSSDPPETFGIGDWVDCLAGLLDAAGVQRAHILGLSWGGILAQEFYRRHSMRVLSLVLADTYAGWKGSLPEPIVEERLVACLRDASLPPGEFVPKYLPGMFSESATQEVQKEFANIMSGFHPVGFRLMAADRRSPMNIAYQIRDAIPGARLAVISGAGHVSNLEKPAQFNTIVRDFCLPLSTM